jgi:mono/diheme cytochrome c family protein
MLVAILLLTASPALADGAAVFDANCSICHQGGGVGVPGQFPRLAGRAGQIASKPEGRAFLSRVIINGMSGRVTVDGQPILGIMPSFDGLSDDDIAQLLTYLTGLDHAPVRFTATEIASTRAQPRVAPSDMAAEHARLAAKKLVP